MLLMLAGVILACRIGAEQPAKPTIVITFPQAGNPLAVGQEVIVEAVAVDAEGLARIELWVDGQPVESLAVEPAVTSFTAKQLWIPQAAGRHIVEMRAYNLDEEPGEPAQVVVTVVQATAEAVAGGQEAPSAVVTGSVEPPATDPAGQGSNNNGPLVTATVNLNIRSGPGVEYPAVGALLAGQAASVVGRNSAGTWWQIVYEVGSEPGWVSSSAKYSTAVRVEAAPVVEAPPPPTATPTATSTPSPTPTPTLTPTPRQLVTYGLTADHDAILVGESVVLRWNLNNADTAYLRYNDLEEVVDVPGNKIFYPVRSTTYSLVTRVQEDEEIVAQLTVRVIDATATPVSVLRDGKSRIVDGQGIDFDQGVVYQEENADVEFYWDGKRQTFLPQGGSAAALLDLAYQEITLSDCRLAAYQESLPKSGATTKTVGCYITGEGRYGKFRVSEWDSVGSLTVEWLTWNYR